ncbi:hypothetical protein EMIT0P176_270009 [Pseudomonas sp. IT-P176]
MALGAALMELAQRFSLLWGRLVVGEPVLRIGAIA